MTPPTYDTATVQPDQYATGSDQYATESNRYATGGDATRDDQYTTSEQATTDNTVSDPYTTLDTNQSGAGMCDNIL